MFEKLEDFFKEQIDYYTTRGHSVLAKSAVRTKTKSTKNINGNASRGTLL